MQKHIAILLVFGMSTPLFSMEVETGLRKARGTSQVVQNTLKKFFDSPLQSPTKSPKEPRTPDVNLGHFDSEDLLETPSDNETDAHFFLEERYYSPADTSKNWREDSRSKATGSKKIPGSYRKKAHFYSHRHQKGFVSYTPVQPLQNNSSSSEKSGEDITWPPARSCPESIALAALTAQVIHNNKTGASTSGNYSAFSTENHFNGLEETTV